MEKGDRRERHSMPGTGKTILVVDDIAANLYVVCRIFHASNYETIEAMTGVDALNQACRFHPDAIVLDMNLPDQTGLITLKQLRAEPETASIPVVFLSAVAQSSSDRTAPKQPVRLHTCSVRCNRKR